MIKPIPGWTFELDENAVTLRRKARPLGATIRYSERVRPTGTVPELIERHVRASSGRVLKVHPVEKALTHEGERAAVVTLDLEDAQQTLGFVLVDDFHAQIVGLARDREARPLVADAVKKLTAGDSHMLGARRRLFAYDGPPGWRRTQLGSAYCHRWLPDDPATGCELTVLAAIPSNGDARQVSRAVAQESMLGFRTRAKLGPDPVRTREGMHGELWTLFGDRDRLDSDGDEIDSNWVRLAAIFHGPAHVYFLYLDAPSRSLAAAQAQMAHVIGSVERVPAPATARLADAIRHWID